MPTLLDTVKRQPATRDIPFVCCRLLPTMLRNQAGPAAAAERLSSVLVRACANQRAASSCSLHGGSRPP